LRERGEASGARSWFSLTATVTRQWSRAYYAMFYLAEAFLLEKGLGFSKHSAVIAAFGKEFANTGKVPSQYHLFLRKAAQDRVVGDYEFTSSLTKEQADLHISRAEDFLSMAEPLLRN
jgi:uncharacterized protein (UPF0332 family)